MCGELTEISLSPVYYLSEVQSIKEKACPRVSNYLAKGLRRKEDVMCS
jgi:hypothetical protein